MCRGEDGSVAVLKPLPNLSQDDIGLHRRPVCAAALHNSTSDELELMRLDAKKKTMDDVLISMPFYYFLRLSTTFSLHRPDSKELIQVRLGL